MAKIVFRTDASLQMGSGHVIRCLTLAKALTTRGAECHFISREHPGHLLNVIRQRGFIAHALPAGPADFQPENTANNTLPAHARWLGCDWQSDAQQTQHILSGIQPDWLIIDHYALDQHWEASLQAHYRKLMVIDDLADRAHLCDLLLDQNLGRKAQDYASLAPSQCTLLIGPQFALLRPEFAELREYSLQRRAYPQLKQLLITMGGVDKDNATGQVLEALLACPLPADCRITVVMGATAPWLDQVRALAAQLPWSTEVLVNIEDMAQRMADSDLAIGAAGGTAWERSCLGLPTLMAVLAENQYAGASALHSAQAAHILGPIDNVKKELPEILANMLRVSALKKMSENARQMTDGSGARLVIEQLELP